MELLCYTATLASCYLKANIIVDDDNETPWLSCARRVLCKHVSVMQLCHLIKYPIDQHNGHEKIQISSFFSYRCGVLCGCAPVQCHSVHFGLESEQHRR
jgi:hypothetical protein